MDNLVSINQTKENTLTFNLTVEGINADAVKAKFCIVVEGMEIALACTRQKGDEWEVTVPVMPFLERTVYPFHIDVVADGYHFEPMKGNVNVVGTNEVYVSAPKNPTVKSPIKTEEPVKVPVVEAPKQADLPKTKTREKSIAQIAQELVEKKTETKPAAKSAPQPTPVLTEAPTDSIKIEGTPVKVELKPFLPKIDVSAPKKGDKDETVRTILEEAGLKTKSKAKKYPRGMKAD